MAGGMEGLAYLMSLLGGAATGANAGMSEAQARGEKMREFDQGNFTDISPEMGARLGLPAGRTRNTLIAPLLGAAEKEAARKEAAAQNEAAASNLERAAENFPEVNRSGAMDLNQNPEAAGTPAPMQGNRYLRMIAGQQRAGVKQENPLIQTWMKGQPGMSPASSANAPHVSLTDVVDPDTGEIVKATVQTPKQGGTPQIVMPAQRVQSKDIPVAQARNDIATGGPASDEALYPLAVYLEQTAKLPEGITRNPRLQKQILEKHAELFPNSKVRAGVGPVSPEEGGPAGMAEKAAGYKSDVTSQQALQKSYAGVSAFEKTAIRNADLALQLSDKVERLTGVPFLDYYAMQGQRGGLGDPAVTQYVTALQTFKSEYSRVMTANGPGAQMTTDAAQRKVDSMIHEGMSKKQLAANIATMKMDMQNRIGAFEEQLGGIQGSIRNRGRVGAPRPAAPAAAPAPAPRPQYKEGERLFSPSQNRWGTIRGNDWIPE